MNNNIIDFLHPKVIKLPVYVVAVKISRLKLKFFGNMKNDLPKKVCRNNENKAC